MNCIPNGAAGRLSRCLLLTLLCLQAPPALTAGHAAEPRGSMFTRDGQRYTIPQGSPLRERIAVAEVHDDAVPDRVSVPAVVEADPARSANVLPPLTGRLLRLAVHLGDRVARGQLVAEINSPDLTQAFADYRKAVDAEELAHKAHARAAAVLEAGGNAGKDLEQAHSALAQAQAERERAAERLRALGLDPAQLPDAPRLALNAPIAGVVTAVSSAAGGFIADPTAALVTISNLDQLWVAAQVPEDLLAQVRSGQAVDVRMAAFPDQVLHGKVATLAAVLDPDTRRTRVRVPFANPEGRLRPNMYGTATLVIPRARQVRVPASALVMVNDSISVFIEVAPWQFERRVVETGSEDASGVRIVKGLRAGQHVIVRGGVLLND
ncbi:MAG: efflux RND transporter periplasmic adaptor subunit [Pseudomonadota bacterium]|nr:efflux RND transporter periplasmic adaptor subunit [Pseudomonadota bacterium]